MCATNTHIFYVAIESLLSCLTKVWFNTTILQNILSDLDIISYGPQGYRTWPFSNCWCDVSCVYFLCRTQTRQYPQRLTRDKQVDKTVTTEIWRKFFSATKGATKIRTLCTILCLMIDTTALWTKTNWESVNYLDKNSTYICPCNVVYA